MLYRTLVTALPAAFISILPAGAGSQSLNAEALEEISLFAEKLCGEYWREGESESIELSGSAKAELEGLLGRLADLGVEGAAKLDSTSYVGVLQEDLQGELSDVRECRLTVWRDLQSAVISPEPAAASAVAPHAPEIEINQRYLTWEEDTTQFRLEPGESRVLKGMEMYKDVATYPRSSCAGPGFVPYTWQVRVPYPKGGDLEIRRVLMGGKTEQVGLGSMGRATMEYCGEHTFKNNGTETIQIEVRYVSAADPDQ